MQVSLLNSFVNPWRHVRRQAAFVAVLASLLAQSAVAGEVGQSAAAAQAPLTRAEVVADLRLWHRSGADQYAELARYYGLNVAEYDQAVAEYKRLRTGPAYAAEVAKVLAEEQANRGVAVSQATVR
ncbi:MAG: DUF4148 domain-containing protein [Burkholderiales bacterium]|nr:MAG: DUF4148 domain-containing protein [Burkholderiales bacterium]